MGWLPGIPWWRTWRLAYVPGALLVALLAWNLLPHGPSSPATVVAQRQAKLVYHVNASGNVSTALRNLANLLDSAPGVQVVVVANDAGIDFLLAGARDAEGKLFEPAITRLKERGVDFRVCGNTLARRNIDSVRIVREAVLVPSGIAEISRLQSQEGYAYMKL
jgi:intracellular sulfur oxidation DsrE/DsrF family protein